MHCAPGMVETRAGSSTHRQSPVKYRRPHRSPPRYRDVKPFVPPHTNGIGTPQSAAFELTDLVIVLVSMGFLYVIYTSLTPEKTVPASATGTAAGFFKSLRFQPLWPLWRLTG